MRTRLIPTMLVTVGLFAASCGGSPTAEHTPRVVALDATSLVVGQTLNFAGKNFTRETTESTSIQFEGIYYFEDENGKQWRRWVDLTINPLYDGEFITGGNVGDLKVSPGTQILRWNRFGPFRNPFAKEQYPGRFEGKVRAIVNKADGTQIKDPAPPSFVLTIESSIVVDKLEPITDVVGGEIETADCGHPALRAIEGMPYVMEVSAMGFGTDAFTFEFNGVNGGRSMAFEVPAIDNRGKIGYDELIVFDQLPADSEFGIATVVVTARDKEGNRHATAMPITIVRPLQFYTDGERNLAEYYEPEVVHGPIVGAIGTSVSYSESHSESRQRGVAVQISKNFAEQQSVTNTDSWSEGISVGQTRTTESSIGQTESYTETNSETYGTTTAHTESDNVAYTSTDGSAWSYSNTDSMTEFDEKIQEHFNSSETGVKVGADLSIPILSWLTGTAGFDYGMSSGTKDSERSGVRNEHSETETNTESHEESRTFGNVISNSTSETFSGSYAVATQNAINKTTTESEATTESVTYNMGTSSANTESYTTGASESFNESWMTTESDSSLLSYSSRVPRGRCAVVYRQTVRFVRTAKIYSHSLCGVRDEIAELTFNEWSWAPNIAIGDDCTRTLPASTQPKAQCFMACE